MKKVNFLSLTLLIMAIGFSNAAFGQYDDLYYDPDRDAGRYNTNVSRDRSTPASEPVASTKGGYDDDDYDEDADYDQSYDNDEYAYYDDYDYYYSSRIRRFHRPYYGFSYFDPCYADLYYYDPFINPGMTVLIYDGYYNSWNSWRTFRRWNRFNAGYGFGYGWNRWNDPWYYNSWNRWNDPWFNGYGNNFYTNNYYGYGGGWNNWGNGYYCPPSWGNGYNYTTVNTVNTHYGPRTTGSTRVPRQNDRSPGIERPGAGTVTREERQTNAPGGVTTNPGAVRDGRRPATENGETRTGVIPGNSETPSRTARPEYQDRNPSNERPRMEEQPVTPRREYTPSRRDEETTPSRTPRTDESRTPRREETTPSRPRTDDAPAREYRERERSRSSEESPRNSAPSRSYDSGRQSSPPSRSYDNGSSRQSSPRSNDSGGSRSNSGGRSNGGGRSGGRNGG